MTSVTTFGTLPALQTWQLNIFIITIMAQSCQYLPKLPSINTPNNASFIKEFIFLRNQFCCFLFMSRICACFLTLTTINQVIILMYSIRHYVTIMINRAPYNHLLYLPVPSNINVYVMPVAVCYAQRVKKGHIETELLYQHM